jgi:predicted ATPase/transcriptional regulator with XRE-family HTH domain
MHTVDVKSFGQWLRQRRKALDLTQDDLAERVGCAPATVRMIEKGQRRPSKQMADVLAECLRVPEEERTVFLALARGRETQRDEGPPPVTRIEAPSNLPPNNLPTQLTPLVGRDDVLEGVVAAIRHDDVRLLTLTGAPGIGKTRLALEAGMHLLPNFSDGVFLVTLTPIRDPSLVLPALAGVLGLHDEGTKPVALALKDHLQRQHLLFVLDNFEQVVEAGPSLVDLLWSCPGVKMLVTSREALHVRGERQYPVPSLDLDASVQLFVQRAQEVEAHFSLTEENRAAVREICAGMEGVPLAIELVAARVRLFPPRILLARLNGPGYQAGSASLPMLVGGSRDLPERHRTLRSAIRWSYDLLMPAEQKLFRRLGVFVGGCTLPSAEAVCNAQNDLGLNVAEGLLSLLDKSLLKRQDRQSAGSGDEPRYAMLDMIHEYASERLVESGEADEVRLLHAEYYLAMTSALASAPLQGSEKELLNRLDQEYDNLRAVLSWVIEKRESNMALQFSRAMHPYWITRSLYRESRDWLERIIACESGQASTEPEGQARVAELLYYIGAMSLYMTDYSVARSRMEASLALFEDAYSEKGIVRALLGLANVVRMQGDYAAAEAYLERGLEAVQALDNSLALRSLLWSLGIVVGERGEYERASALLDRSLALSKEANDLYTSYGVLRDQGMVLSYAGRHHQAIVLFERFLDIARQSSFRVGVSWALDGMAFSVMRQGDHARARELYKESLTLAKVLDRHRIPDSLEGLAEIELAHARGEGAQPGVGSASYSGHEFLRRAATLLGAAEAVRGLLKSKTIPVKAPVRERLVLDVQARMGAAEYEQAYRAGERLSLEEAIDFALKELNPTH